MKWDRAGYVCRMPSDLQAKITSERKPHNGEAADIVGGARLLFKGLALCSPKSGPMVGEVGAQ